MPWTTELTHAPAAMTTRRASQYFSPDFSSTSFSRGMISATGVLANIVAPLRLLASTQARTVAEASTTPAWGWNTTGDSKRMPGQRRPASRALISS